MVTDAELRNTQSLCWIFLLLPFVLGESSGKGRTRQQLDTQRPFFSRGMLVNKSSSTFLSLSLSLGPASWKLCCDVLLLCMFFLLPPFFFFSFFCLENIRLSLFFKNRRFHPIHPLWFCLFPFTRHPKRKWTPSFNFRPFSNGFFSFHPLLLCAV